MALNFILLFVTAMVAGGLAYFIPSWEERYFKLVLVFAGSYLFAITVLHILPELFVESGDSTKMGLFILMDSCFNRFWRYFLQEWNMDIFITQVISIVVFKWEFGPL